MTTSRQARARLICQVERRPAGPHLARSLTRSGPGWRRKASSYEFHCELDSAAAAGLASESANFKPPGRARVGHRYWQPHSSCQRPAGKLLP